MSIVKLRYQTLGPSSELLSDIAVLAQAWKKTHQYIRRHNWYADVLELDISTFNLEQNIIEWSQELRELNYSPKPMKLVLAPKTSRWVFRKKTESNNPFAILSTEIDEIGDDPSFNDWRPERNSQDGSIDYHQPLRPLAHVSIRDQVISSAIMACLSNTVETAQGNPGLDSLEARNAGMVSYGNRLHCAWKEIGAEELAEFSWGNSRSYSQYFLHYQAFLARPERVCRELRPSLKHNKELFVVSLDLKGFYNKIDRSRLLEKLRALCDKDNVASNDLDTEIFWEQVENSFKWQWDKEDQSRLKNYCDIDPAYDLGLPQGLMASGFFANAYMLEFDERLVSSYKDTESGMNTRILDYCRYVDDIRLVVSDDSGSNSALLEGIKNRCQEFIRQLLREAFGETEDGALILDINPDKTDIQPYYTLTRHGRTSSLMKSLNSDISGPLDTESLKSAAGGLEGLLAMSTKMGNSKNVNSRLSLSAIAAPTNDVKDETVKRFIAGRLASTLRERLMMAAPSSSNSDTGSSWLSVESERSLTHEFESAARRFIQLWSEDPSLVILLKTGLDLFPHPKLLKPVIDALKIKLEPHEDCSIDNSQKYASFYIISDLLKAGATETGYGSDRVHPSTSNLEGYRSELKRLAKEILNLPSSPWFAKQQAYLFLASVGDVSRSRKLRTEDHYLNHYKRLIRALRYCDISEQDLDETLPVMLIAQQMQPNPTELDHWIISQLDNWGSDDAARRMFHLLTINASKLFINLLESGNLLASRWHKQVPPVLLEYAKIRRGRMYFQDLPGEISLLHTIAHKNNPFEDENCLLALTESILDYLSNTDNDTELAIKSLSEGLSPAKVLLQCDDWSLLSSFKTHLKARLQTEDFSSLHSPPDWLEQDTRWMYGLGQLLRSALVGNLDYSSREFMLREDRPRYSGMRSTWFQRRLGLHNRPASLSTDNRPITPWLSSFLSALLRWPGISLGDSVARSVDQAKSPIELLQIVRDRIDQQEKLFGNRTRTPFYVIPTSDTQLVNRPIRMAVVQPLRPKINEFDLKDPTHWTESDMAAHYRHLAEMCKLTVSQVNAWRAAKDEPFIESSLEKPFVDLVLFPELSVHPEHIHLLRKLSDALGASIFSGLTFQNHEKTGAIINQGLWLIRTQHQHDGRGFEYVWQGKQHPTKNEREMGVQPHRPHITLVELPIGEKHPTRVAAAICYDATDLELAADLREQSDMFLISAMNKDVQTFDNMVSALHYHMYQPVILANTGEYGGSTSQAPYSGFEKLISHSHGGNQIALSLFEIKPWHFNSTPTEPNSPSVKTSPAGFKNRI